MLDFRKVLLASVAGLGLVATASAQVPTCALAVNNEGYVAVEGTTEEIPQLQLTCTNAGTFTGPLSLTLTGSVAFANQSISSANTNLDIDVRDSAGDIYGATIAAPVTAVGTVTQPGPSSIQITLNTVTAAATNTFWITGVRVNPSTLSAGATVTVSSTSSSVQVTNTSAVNAAFAAKTISTVVIDAGGAVANTSICGITANTNPTLFAVGNATVTAGFLNSLKSAGDYQNNPLSTSYYAAPAPQTDANAKAATIGSRFLVTISNLDTAGVSYYVPPTITGTNVTLTAYAAATGGTAATTATSPANAAGLVALTVSATGTATVYYGVSGGTTAGGTESFIVPVQAAVAAPSAVTGFNTTPITVSLQIVGATAPAYPGENASASAYNSTLQTGNATNGLLTACATTLLFPYVTNTNTFDTGLAISNASTGIGSTVLSTNATIPSTSGSCSLTFYGTVNGTAPTTAPTATVTVSTGTVQSIDVGSTTGLAGFSGYAVASCNFVGGHGYAFLFTTAGGGLAANYLAPVLSSGSYLYNANGGTAVGTANVITPTF